MSSSLPPRPAGIFGEIRIYLVSLAFALIVLTLLFSGCDLATPGLPDGVLHDDWFYADHLQVFHQTGCGTGFIESQFDSVLQFIKAKVIDVAVSVLAFSVMPM